MRGHFFHFHSLRSCSRTTTRGRGGGGGGKSSDVGSGGSSCGGGGGGDVGGDDGDVIDKEKRFSDVTHVASKTTVTNGAVV